MISPNRISESSSEYCEYDVTCGTAAVNYCQGCGQMYCMNHYLKHRKKLQKRFEYILHTHDVLRQKLNSLISELPADAILDLRESIHEFEMKLSEIENKVRKIQQWLPDVINEDKQDFKNELNRMTNGLDSDQNGHYENDIEDLRKDIKELTLKLEEINNYDEQSTSQDQQQTANINVRSKKLPKIIKSSLANLVLLEKLNHLRSAISIGRNGSTSKEEEYTVLSYSLHKKTSSSVLSANKSESFLNEEEEEEMIGVIDFDSTARITRKIRLSNNVVRWLRGPLKLAVHGMLHVVDVCAREKHVSESTLQAVNQGLARQKQISMEQQTTNNLLKPVFVEITSDWTYEGENEQRGFSSPSIWLRDPQGRRVLFKIQDLPICAANEWLAYALGVFLGLPVNEVQIGIYQNNLITVHTDVAQEHEKTITFMNLPTQLRRKVLTDPAMQCMDLFDHIIQNVDRNQQNILITMLNTTTIDDDTAKLKIHLIDHASSFGMGKLNIISLIASKLHSKHLAVVRFDPIDEARKFEQYLGKLPKADRILIRSTLNRFAAITDDQFDSWMSNIQDLLSSNQYDRIHDVLYRQRDTVRRYRMEWGFDFRASSTKPNKMNQPMPETDNLITYF